MNEAPLGLMRAIHEAKEASSVTFGEIDVERDSDDWIRQAAASFGIEPPEPGTELFEAMKQEIQSIAEEEEDDWKQGETEW